jgi:hypothetical protein
VFGATKAPQSSPTIKCIRSSANSIIYMFGIGLRYFSKQGAIRRVVGLNALIALDPNAIDVKIKRPFVFIKPFLRW